MKKRIYYVLRVPNGEWLTGEYQTLREARAQRVGLGPRVKVVRVVETVVSRREKR